MFKVYYTNPETERCYSQNFEALSETLSCAESRRKEGMTFVTMVSENPNSVGKSGVDEVKDGKCPDGVAYDWNKSSRIGRTKKR